MKKLSFIIIALVATISFATVSAQQDKKAPKAEFAKHTHDFGKIKESDKTATTTFTFKNKGNAPLIIQRAQASCGCTTPDYTKEPVLPGKEGNITVTYSTVGRPGFFDKNITIFTNVPDSVYVLKIKGEVIRER